MTRFICISLTFHQNWYFSNVVLKFLGIFSLKLHLILRTSWFHYHTLYSCCFGLPCLNYLKVMKYVHGWNHAHLKMESNFGWCTFLQELIHFFNLPFGCPKANFGLLYPIGFFKNCLNNFIRERGGPHS